jgi:hypothetical protein
MDSTNNQIYKIAKYLDKYTKYGNKEGGVYLQKLDNYLHKVQHGGNGEIVKLAEEIGRMVEEVVRVHQQVKSKLQELSRDVKGDNVEAKVMALQEQISGLKERIARKKAEKLAREASPSLKASASAAPKPITFETLTSENITSIDETILAQIIATLAIVRATEKINDESILNLVRDIGTYEKSQIITDIKQNFGSLTAATILKKLYTDGAFESLSRNYKTTILFIEITIAILKIKKKIISIDDVDISELEKIVSFFISSSSEKCKEIVSKLFIEFVNTGQTITSYNFTDFIEKDWMYLVSCTDETRFKSILFTKEIIAKEVCRRMNIIDAQEIQKIVEEFSNVTIFWFIAPTISFLPYLSLLYRNQYFKDNAKLAIDFAKELIKMKFDAIEIRKSLGHRLNELGIESIDSDRGKFRQQTGQIDEIIKYINNDANKIKMFIEYVIEQNIYSSVPTLTGFKRYELSKASPASVPVSALASSAFRKTVPPITKQLAAEAMLQQQQQQQLRAVPQKNLSNPFSKKFDIVGFTIIKDSNISYVIPDDQKEKVLEVLSPELKKKSKDVKLSSDQKKARIEFTEDLPIKDILNEINDRKDPQPIVFETTGSRSAGKPLNVWLFIVPMTFKIDVGTNDADRPYLEAINKLADDELEKIASIMEGIIKQSPGGSAAPTLASEAMTDDSLTSKKFDVVGYIDTIDYVFPTKEKTEGKTEGKETVNVLIEEQQQPILSALQLQLADIKKEESFKVTESGVRIVLQNPVNIREFVNSINKKPTNVSLTHSGQYDTVRLFIKPMTFGERNNPINILASKINKEIRAEIVQQPHSVQQQWSASSSSRGRGGLEQSRGRGAKGESMSSRGPYRHPLTND